jgi:hypothetical protein
MVDTFSFLPLFIYCSHLKPIHGTSLSVLLFFIADTDRELAGSLIIELKKESLVTSAQFLESFRELVSHMAEKDQEIPRIYSHVAGEWTVFTPVCHTSAELKLTFGKETTLIEVLVKSVA